MRFSDQVVWITGASSGIGEALAVQFSREGARLVLSSRRPAALERVRARCARPDEHVISPLDLARSETFPAIVRSVLAQRPRIDLLVNNGGVSQRSRAIDASPATERELMEVDYFGQIALTKAVLPAMLDRRAGRVVVISSVMGYVGTPGRSSYAAAKHALHGYFDSLRAELWRDGVKVTLVCPGYVQTAVGANALGPTGKNEQVHAESSRGISAERCAAKIFRGLHRRRDEIYVGGPEVAAIYLQRFVPWLFSRMVRRFKFRA
jgi:short-subunit dehydrogenase